MASRSLGDLHPKVQNMAFEFMKACKERDIEVLITCTYRTHEEQEYLYSLGRTQPGKKVTNAKPGESFHNYGLALDFVPLRGGKPVWGTAGADLELWTECGEIAEEIGFEWAGRWTKFREFPHIQWTGGRSLRDLQLGNMP